MVINGDKIKQKMLWDKRILNKMKKMKEDAYEGILCKI